MSKQLLIVPLTLSLLALASCDGDGLRANGGIAIGPQTPAPGRLPISATTATAVTSEVIGTVRNPIDLVEIVKLINRRVVGSLTPRAAAVAPGLIIPLRAAPCDSGLIRGNWDDADNNRKLSTGDSFDLEFEKCLDRASGLTLNGKTSLNNLTVSGDPFAENPPWRLFFTYRFDALAITSRNLSGTLDGTVSYNTNSNDNVTVNLGIVANAINVQESARSYTLSNYSLVQVTNTNALTRRIDSGGTLTSTTLGGNVAYQTVADFVIMGTDNPSSGQMLINHATSSVRVTVQDNMNVRLDIDANRDGVVDSVITVGWDKL